MKRAFRIACLIEVPLMTLLIVLTSMSPRQSMSMPAEALWAFHFMSWFVVYEFDLIFPMMIHSRLLNDTVHYAVIFAIQLAVVTAITRLILRRTARP